MEKEIRAIANEDFLEKLNDYQLSETKSYGPYVDEYYRPRGISPKEFDQNDVTLRIRKQSTEKEVSILLDKTSCENGLKKSVYGKIILFKGSEEMAKDILKTLNFEHWLSIEKRGAKEYRLVDEKSNLDFKFYLEYIEGVGNMIEVEFKTSEAEANADKIVSLLGIEKKNIISKSMASFVAERLGLI